MLWTKTPRSLIRDPRPAPIALIAGLAPIVVVHACYALSVQAGHVPLCLPYLEGCTSISRAARHGLANPLFKAVMLPVAALLALFWWQAAPRLRAISPCAGRIAAMRTIGLIGALFLLPYVLFLGLDGEFARWMRRYGVTVYFSFTVLAQMLLASVLQPGTPLRRRLIGLCTVMLALGLASLPMQHLLANRDALVNAIEWCYALLMSLGFIAVGLHWRREAPNPAPPP